MKNLKTLNLSKHDHIPLKALKDLLAECNDNSEFELKLCIKERNNKFNDRLHRLQIITDRLHNLLDKAKECVEICARLEKNGKPTIYYDRLRGVNGGASDLLTHIDQTLDNYYQDMVKIDLTSEV